MPPDIVNNDQLITGTLTVNTAVNFPAGSITGATLVNNGVGAGKLTTTLGTGIIPLDLMAARIIASNDIQNAGATPPGGILTKDSSPVLERVNAATDKRIRVKWPAAGVAEIQLPPFAYPPDLDATQPLTVKLRAKMSGGTDTPVLTVSFWDNDTGSNIGGNTAALSSSFQTVTVTVSSVSAPPARGNLTITPGAHGTDAVELDAVWIEYFRK